MPLCTMPGELLHITGLIKRKWYWQLIHLPEIIHIVQEGFVWLRILFKSIRI